MASLTSKLTVLQHNVLHWSHDRRNELCNTYRLHDPDIILINSHGLTDSQRIKIFPYNTYQTNKSGQRNDGVAIAIKSTITHKLIENLAPEIIAVEVNTTHGPIIIATLYLPPRRPYIPYPDLNQLLRQHKPVYILGDWNANHTQFGYTTSNPVGRALVSLISDGTLQHLGPHFPTYIGIQRNTTPDLVLANNRITTNIHLKQGDLTTSDHLPIVATISTNPILIPITPRERQTHANWEGFREALSDTTTPDLDGQPAAEIDTQLQHWYTDIQNARRDHIPTTTHRTLPHHTDTPELRLLKVQYRAVYDLATLRGWDPPLRQRLRELRTQLYYATKQHITQQWQELCSKLCHNHHDSKTFWNTYNRLMGSNRQHCTYIYNQHRHKITTTEAMEETHRHYWTQNFQISQTENLDFDRHTETLVTEYLQRHQHLLTPTPIINLNTLDNNDPLTAHITPGDLTNIIKYTKNKAPGPSTINKPILQHLPPNMIHRLCTIFNASLACGHFPSIFKSATTVLIPKPNLSIHEVTSYRPISLLELPGKLLERVLNTRLTTHLENNNLHNNRQYGFRRQRGTDTATTLAYEEIALSLANKQQTNIVLRDVSKAFDKIWHDGLKYKLMHLNIPANIKQILCDYLTNRHTNIKLKNYLGPPIPLRSGVPQGSIISPTFYIYYTSDLPLPSPFSNYISYADDITQLITHPSKSKHIMKLATQTAITNINTYETQWKIRTNINKFHIIPAARRNPPLITINNTDIPYTYTGTMLGVHMNTHGTSIHARERARRAKSALARLKRFSSCTTQTKLQLYKTLIRPILEYPPIPLVTNSLHQQINIQRVQNRALRWVDNTTYPYTHTIQQLHHKYNIEPMNTRIHTRAKNIWDKLHENNDELYTHIHEIHTNTHRHHGWWPRSLPICLRETPPPLYIAPTQHIPQNDSDDDDLDL